MNFKTFGIEGAPVLMLIPGLGVSYEIFLPLVRLLEDRFRIIAVEVGGFVLGTHTRFISIDGQASQIIEYIKTQQKGEIACAYGLSLPSWLVGPLKHIQAANVWTCYHWTGFWRLLFRSHYFDVLLNECRKIYPFGGKKAVLDGYTSVYRNTLESISGDDIHFWYGTKEAFVAKPQVRHLKAIYPTLKVEVFNKMNHGQLLIDHPDEVADRLIRIQYE